MIMKNFPKVYVDWSGKYPCLCYGIWTIKINDKEIEIPFEKTNKDMGTFGTYCRWFFGENYREEFNYYEDGMVFSDWIQENTWLIDEVKKNCLGFDEDEISIICENIFEEIQKNDFRCGS